MLLILLKSLFSSHINIRLNRMTLFDHYIMDRNILFHEYTFIMYLTRLFFVIIIIRIINLCDILLLIITFKCMIAPKTIIQEIYIVVLALTGGDISTPVFSDMLGKMVSLKSRQDCCNKSIPSCLKFIFGPQVEFERPK